MSIEVRYFGKTATGQQVDSYTLYLADGVFCTLLSYGASLQRLLLPDREGLLQDVVLGYDRLADYEKKSNPYHGAVVGRFANRIEAASFQLDGKTYQLAANDGPNHLHGGLVGLSRVVWQADPFITKAGPAVSFHYTSPDLEEGYPGNLALKVTYTLEKQHSLKIEYEAVSDQNTIVSLTNHSYFNLRGQGSGTILDHELQIEADYYTPIDQVGIPTGQIEPVAGTAFDFTSPHPIGAMIDETAAGYDHNFVIRGEAGQLRPCARVFEPKSGRTMQVLTSLPGMQFYSGNFMEPDLGKEGAFYDWRNGFCLETQHFPNSPRQTRFPSPVLAAGQTYRQTTSYSFGVK